uniref:Uncharacterized protein n=1 Tax=Gouania willdenowi TaxID=441366 RepID=A0A8C5E1V3_GOUWI
MVFQWFHSTAYMMDDEVGSLVEKLKPQFVTKWLKTVCEVRFDVMVMCLLPKPVEFARVRNAVSSRCGSALLPEWLESIRTEVPDNQLKEFREVLRYIHLLNTFTSLCLATQRDCNNIYILKKAILVIFVYGRKERE